jgi:Skp family chaperone for outer membrane proteins
MKSSVKFILAAALTVLGAASLTAQPTPKIVVIDFQKAYEGYWDTAIQQAKLNDYAEQAKKQAEPLVKDRADLITKYQELAAKVTGDPTITAAAKAEAEKQGADLRKRIQDKEADLQLLSKNTNDVAANTIANYRGTTIPLITEAAKKIAQQKGANMLIDRSNNNNFGTSSFLWLDSAYTDITEEVLKSLNAGHPTAAAPLTPLAPVAPVPAGTMVKPAASDSAAPSVVFPAPKAP